MPTIPKTPAAIVDKANERVSLNTQAKDHKGNHMTPRNISAGNTFPSDNQVNTATNTVLPSITTTPGRTPSRKVVKATAAPLRMLSGGNIMASTPVPTVTNIAWLGPRKMKDANDFILLRSRYTTSSVYILTTKRQDR
jgi:hypothetical protein